MGNICPSTRTPITKDKKIIFDQKSTINKRPAIFHEDAILITKLSSLLLSIHQLDVNLTNFTKELKTNIDMVVFQGLNDIAKTQIPYFIVAENSIYELANMKNKVLQ